MAIIEFTSIDPSPNFPRASYQASENLTSPGNGSWLIIKPGMQQVNVDLLVTGEGYIETTNDRAGAIAGTATGIKWDAGNVVANTQGSAKGVAAVRAVNVSGTVKMIANGVI